MPKDELDLDQVGKSIGEVKTAFETFKQKNDERLAEIEKKGSADVLLEEQITKINEDLNKKQEILDSVNARMRRMAVEAKTDDHLNREEKALLWAKMAGKARGDHVTEFTVEQMDEYKAAFLKYVRKDDKVMVGDEAKALSVGSDPDGGYVVYPDMNGRIVSRIYETSPARQYASVQSITTDALEGLHDTDEASSGWVGETASRPQTDTPELDKWRIPVHEQYAAPRATQKLLDDAAIDMEGWLARKIADKLARRENDAFVNGDGVGKPRGFLTYANWTVAGTYQLGAIERFATGANGAFAAAPDGGDVLINALYGLKDQYRMSATWFMNRSTMAAVRKLKDSDGAYLWAPGIVAGQGLKPATRRCSQ